MAQELEERVDDGQKAGVDNRSSSELTWPTLEPEAHSRKSEAANRKQRTTEENGEIVNGQAAQEVGRRARAMKRWDESTGAQSAKQNEEREEGEENDTGGRERG